jgi:hypothetical protein
MAIGTLMGAIGGLILSAYGMYKQEQEAGRLRLQFRKEERKEEERYQTGLQLGREAVERKERETRRAWAWKEEERDYSRAQDFVRGFNGLIDDPRQGSADLFNIWSRRAA